MELPDRPTLRGVLHQWAAILAVVGGSLLVVLAPAGHARAAAAVYAASLVGMLGTSALYHRWPWSPAAKKRMRAADHSMIFVVIAGTYTPACVIAVGGTLGAIVLASVWAGAVLGAVIEVRWPDGPRWRSAVAYIALGWVAVVVAPSLARAVDTWVLVLIAVGGVLYTLGGVVYARQRPDPWPSTFGFHEVFHALVVAGAALHFAAMTAILL